jgi:hypothetical protein
MIYRMIKARRMRLAWHVACTEKRNAYRILVGKPEGNRLLGRFRHGGDDAKMNLRGKALGWFGLDWSGSGSGPVAGFCEHGNELEILYFSVLLCLNSLLMGPSPQFVYKLYVLLYIMCLLLMAIMFCNKTRMTTSTYRLEHTTLKTNAMYENITVHNSDHWL